MEGVVQVSKPVPLLFVMPAEGTIFTVTVIILENAVEELEVQVTFSLYSVVDETIPVVSDAGFVCPA